MPAVPSEFEIRIFFFDKLSHGIMEGFRALFQVSTELLSISTQLMSNYYYAARILILLLKKTLSTLMNKINRIVFNSAFGIARTQKKMNLFYTSKPLSALPHRQIAAFVCRDPIPSNLYVINTALNVWNRL